MKSQMSEVRGQRSEGARCEVDAELFDSVLDAIDFVAARGGGVVYTRLFGTHYVQGLTLPEGVELRPARTEEDQTRLPTDRTC